MDAIQTMVHHIQLHHHILLFTYFNTKVVHYYFYKFEFIFVLVVITFISILSLKKLIIF